MSRTFRALKVESFRWYASASLMTNTAMWMQRIAQDWLAIQLTGDGAAVGFTTAMQFLPGLIVSPIAGNFADRWPRRMMLVLDCIAMSLPAMMLGLIIMFGHPSIWHVYGFAALLGIASGVDSPVRQAYVRDIMSRDDLINAMGLQGIIFHTSRIIGPAMAGFLISGIGIAAGFMAVSVSYLIAAAILFRIRTKPREEEDAPALDEKPGLAGGFQLLARNPGLIVIMMLTACVSSFAGNFQVSITIMATKTFGLSAGEFGSLTSMMAIGSIFGALQVARMYRPSFAIVLTAASLLGSCYLLASAAPTPVLFGLVLLPIGTLSSMYLSTAGATVQLRVPPRFQGRIAGIYQACGYIFVPVSAVLIGVIADHFTPRTPLALAGLICIAAAGAALTALLLLKVVRWNGRRLQEINDVDPLSTTPPARGEPILDNPV
jgi:MFS family permease